MSRYRFGIEYLGSPFAGWQIQPNAPTVEEELEKALSICLRAPINIIGSGRTDAGVHARGQVAHFDFDGDLYPPKIIGSVNALTSKNIWIRGLELCPDSFHARFDATARYYRYRLALHTTPIFHHLAWCLSYPMDFEKFASELQCVLGNHDFLNFSVDRKDGKPTECLIQRAELEQTDDFVIVHIQGNRFLHKMVRAIVGACYDVARGHHAPGLIREILEGRFTGEWTWAPPHGLCLEKVSYPDYSC